MKDLQLLPLSSRTGSFMVEELQMTGMPLTPRCLPSKPCRSRTSPFPVYISLSVGCVMITEGDEESGSAHMKHYLDSLKGRIGTPELVFCLDSGTIDYDRFWLTKSLRGNLVATLRVENITEGVHSGDSSGIIPSCYRIAQMLLNRI